MLLAPPGARAADGAKEQAQALFERDWQWRLKHQPEFATSVGDHRYDATLSDTSLAGAARALEHELHMLELARQLDRSQLGAQDKLSLDLFAADKERQLQQAAFVAFDPQPITARDGIHIRLPQLAAQMPFVTESDYRAWIARLNAAPRHIEGIIEQLREGMRTGWTAPKPAMAGLPAQLRALREHLNDGPLSEPFRRLPATIPQEVRDQLMLDGQAAISGLAPSLQQLEEFIRDAYLPAARPTIAASSLPGGAAWYAFLVKSATSSDLAPAEIHALGLKEVARIRAEIAALVSRTGFKGNLAQFIAFARSDPRLFYTDADALLSRYRRTIARIASHLPLLFNNIPQDELAVKPVQAAGAEGQGAAYYEAGSPDRAAALVINTSRLNTRPMWEIETLTLHEGLPGHHLQVARARANSALPAFRRYGWYGAYGEGWALYAESLGPDLGLLRDPFPRYGYLADELLRAARLVADTGIHALGWTRQQAIDYLNANTANPTGDNEVEVDRYIARPGEALAYKLGQLRIASLRTEAQTALGERFDVRAFHDAVLDNGPLPLGLLERQVRRWIAAQAPAPAPVPAAAPTPAPVTNN
ncbi:hypothetical protein AB595_27555 [Massilia sp. WF1]|nr:hypothetical protein AB595_27555 [Massilia sp. WF1]